MISCKSSCWSCQHMVGHHVQCPYPFCNLALYHLLGCSSKATSLRTKAVDPCLLISTAWHNFIDTVWTWQCHVCTPITFCPSHGLVLSSTLREDTKMLCWIDAGAMETHVHWNTPGLADWSLLLLWEGAIPPYETHSPHRSRVVNDWLWSMGHTPYGPYSNTSTLSQLTLGSMRRSRIVIKIEKLLRLLRSTLDKLDEFSAAYYKKPFFEVLSSTPATLEPEEKTWLDVMYK